MLPHLQVRDESTIETVDEDVFEELKKSRTQFIDHDDDPDNGELILPFWYT